MPAFNIIDYPGQYQYTSAFLQCSAAGLLSDLMQFHGRVIVCVNYCTLFFTCANAGTTGKLVAIFIIMLVSAMLFLVIKICSRIGIPWFYIYAVLRYFSTSASLNYFVVRELGSLLLIIRYSQNEEIPFGIFWFCTAVIPPAYVYYGIYRRISLL